MPAGSMFFRTLVQTPLEQWAKKPLARIATLRTQSSGDVIPMIQTALTLSRQALPAGSMFFRTLAQTPPEQWAKKPLARIATLRTQSTGNRRYRRRTVGRQRAMPFDKCRP